MLSYVGSGPTLTQHWINVLYCWAETTACSLRVLKTNTAFNKEHNDRKDIVFYVSLIKRRFNVGQALEPLDQLHSNIETLLDQQLHIQAEMNILLEVECEKKIRQIEI